MLRRIQPALSGKLVCCMLALLQSAVLLAAPYYLDGERNADRTICGSDDNLVMVEQNEELKKMGLPVGSLRAFDRDSGRYFICTGTLVGPDLFLTARHCKEACEDLSVTFGYLSPEKREETFKCSEILEAGDFESNHDYLVMRLEGKPGVEWGWYPLSDREIVPETQLMMIHHPRGVPMRVSLEGCKFKAEEDGLLRHRCDTEPGSSGTGILLPDFENPDNTRVVGVHAFGGCTSAETSTNSGPSIHYLATQSELIRSLVKD
ncbi:MAG: trypsin-like peptidase domain-containing protein [Bdellovibrionaceae bacterium]|nr:trypsin-like peptidase domain-containing protein [Pseudobdellovibrionaceae bacterium]